MFATDLFASLVNNAYKLPEEQRLDAHKLEQADVSAPRKAKKAEAYFRLLPDDIPTFDHYTPAYWLIQNPKFLASKTKAVAVTLDNFTRVFETFNKLL